MKSTLYKILAILLILLPFCTLTYTFFTYSINSPHWDDHALKAFQVNFNKSNSIFEKVRLIFAQHNEHRIALTRFFSLLIYEIKGTIDYRWLMIWGNSSLIGIFMVFYVALKKYNYSIFYLAPISFIFFGLQLHENLFWGMASVQNFWVVFFAILAFYLLTISSYKYAFFLAILSSFLAIYTSGNGILVPIIGLILLLILKQKQNIIYWLSSTCVFLFLYFLFYQNAPDATKTHASLHELINLPKAVLVYIGTLIDSQMISPNHRVLIAAFSGGILFVVFSLFLWNTILKKYNSREDKLDLFLVGIILFSLGTALLVSFSRLGYGIGVLFGSKYKIYSTLCFIVFYIILLKSLPNTKVRQYFGFIAFLGATSLWIYGYLLDYQAVIQTRQERIADEFNWTYNLNLTDDPKLIKDFQQVHQPERRFYFNNLKEIIGKIDTTNKNDKIFKITKDSSFVKISSAMILSQNNFSNNYESYLLIKSNTHHYLFPIESPILIPFQFLKFDFEVKIPRNSIQSGNYQIGFLLKNHKDCKVEYTSQLIDIQGLTQQQTKKNW